MIHSEVEVQINEETGTVENILINQFKSAIFLQVL